MRDDSGKFIAGYSGNPGGRPKDEYRVAELARSYTVEAVETLVDLMRQNLVTSLTVIFHFCLLV